MVSPAKQRTSVFSNLRDAPDERSPKVRAAHPRGRGENKYALVTSTGSDAKRRLRRVVDHVKQSLEPFYRAGRNAIHASGVPAAETIRKFLDRVGDRSRRDLTQAPVVELSEFRKCLYALGVSSDDTVFLLDSIDRNRSGVMDSRAFAVMFLPVRSNVNGPTRGSRRRFPGYGESESNNDTYGDDSTRVQRGKGQNIEAFHRKVLERVLVKYANIKDAFRQYDTGRVGVLSVSQFRIFLRDLGFVGGDVDALIRHLDRAQESAISFRAFANTGDTSSGNAYTKHSPKRTAVAPLAATRSIEYNDPIESIRAKLRQRVIGRNKSIREVFLEFDADGNGHLDHGEFKQFMAAYQFTADETSLTIEFLDRDFSGTIDYDEFASGLLFYRPSGHAGVSAQRPPENEDERQRRHGAYLLSVVRERLEAVVEDRGGLRGLREEFVHFDADGSGALDYQEFSGFLVGLGIKLSPRDLDALMLVLDEDGSNQVEFDEFASMLGPQERKAPRHEAPERTVDERDPLAIVFSRYDLDRRGQLDYSEFSQLMRDHGFAEADVLQVIKQLDGHSVGSRRGIDLETFKSVVQTRGWKLNKTSPASKPREKASTRRAPVETALVSRIMQDYRSLEDAFRQHDSDGSGELDHHEFRRFMKHYGVHDEGTINDLIASLDTDSSGRISLTEFLARFQLQPTATKPSSDIKRAKESAALRELKQVWVDEVLERHSSLQDAFLEHDHQGRGQLDYEQFRDLMGQYGISDDRNVRALLTQVDADHSGTVSLDEFLAVFKPLPGKKLATKSKKMSQSTKANIPQPRPARGLVADQAATSAARLRLLEEQWIKQALDAHGSVRAAFDQFDTDASGELDHDEFRQLMRTYGITRDDDIASMIRRLDVDGSGAIDYDEFAALFHEARVPKSNGKPPRKQSLSPIGARQVDESKRRGSQAARLRELELKWIKRALSCHATIEAAFAEYDQDGNGTLDHDEFSHCMKRYGIVQADDIERLIRRLDLDGSGTIDFHEFSTVFNPLRCTDVSVNTQYTNDGEQLDGDELQSVLEIERELADRILRHARDMRQAFGKFDLNGNGRLEYNEFRRVLKSYKFPEPEIRKVIRHLDRDVSGYIDYREFISGLAAFTDTGAGGSNGKKTAAHASRTPTTTTISTRSSPSRKATKSSRRPSPETLKKTLLERILATHGTVQSTFRRYDAARNGSLEPHQFESLVTDLGFSSDEAAVLLTSLDADGSGTIDYDEFLSQLIAEENR